MVQQRRGGDRGKKIGIETTTYVRNIYKYYVAYRLLVDVQEAQEKARATVKPKRAAHPGIGGASFPLRGARAGGALGPPTGPRVNLRGNLSCEARLIAQARRDISHRSRVRNQPASRRVLGGDRPAGHAVVCAQASFAYDAEPRG